MTVDNSVDSLQIQIDAILDINRPLTLEEREHLNTLGDQLAELEKDIEIPDTYGVEILNSIIEDNELTPLDLVPMLGTMSYVESILDGK